MKSLNKVQLIGYLGRDPKIRRLPSGKLTAGLRIATSYWLRQENAGPKRISEWHNIVVWNEEVIKKFANYLIKGSHIMVEGRLTYRTFTGKDGIERQVAEIHSTAITDLDR